MAGPSSACGLLKAGCAALHAHMCNINIGTAQNITLKQKYKKILKN